MVDINGLLSNPMAAYQSAQQPGGFLAPVSNFNDFLSDPRVSIGLKIAQGEPLGKAVFEGAVQAEGISEMQSKAAERKAIKDFREKLQDPNFDPQSIEFADLAKIDIGSVISGLTDEAFGENLVEAYSVSGDTLVYASPLEIKQNDDLIPKDSSRFGDSDATRKDFRYIITDPNTNKKYNAFDTPSGQVVVELDDGTEVPYSNEMFGEGTQAVISTVGNLARSQLTLPQFLTIKTEVEQTEIQLEKLSQFISRNQDLPQGAEKILNQLQSTFKTIFTENKLSNEEFAQRLQAGTFQGLIGANRLEVVGGGVMTEQDAIRIMEALGGDPNSAFTNKEVATALISNILADKYRNYEQTLEVYNNEVSSFSGYKPKKVFTLTDAQKMFFDANALLRLDVNSISDMSREQILRLDPNNLTTKQLEEYNQKFIEYFE
jgi:hypothetical protein